MSAADAADIQAERRAAFAIAQHQETIRIGLINARHQHLSQNPHPTERLPFRVEGDDYGYIAARIPKEEFWHFVQQRNFGYEGFLDQGGLKDFLKTRPACKVKTVSGKTTVGWMPKEGTVGKKMGARTAGKMLAARSRRRVHFGRGTLNLAS